MINKAIIIGNVGADPEVRTLESGIKVCQIRVATTERVKKGEEWTNHTEWHSVVLWRNLADIADKYIHKGSQVFIEGVMRHSEWTDKDNNTHTKCEIVAQDLKLLGRKPEEKATPIKEEEEDEFAHARSLLNRPDSLANQKAQTKQQESSRSLGLEPVAQEDDLPF